MACEIRDIKDPYLKSLILKYGEVGMNRYFKEVGQIISSGQEYTIGMLSDSFEHPDADVPMFDDRGNFYDEPEFNPIVERDMRPEDLYGDQILDREPGINEEDLYDAEAAQMRAEAQEAAAEKAMAAEAKYFSFGDVFQSIDDLIGDPGAFKTMANIDVANGIAMISATMRVKLNDILDIIAKLNINIKSIEKEQLEELKKSTPDQAKIDANSQRILAIRAKIENYREDFDTISSSIINALREKTIVALKSLYNTHAKWASSIISQENPSDAELRGAWEAMEMWQNVANDFSDVHQDKEIKDALRDIENLSNNAEFDKLILLAKNRIADIGRKTFGIEAKERDMTSTSDISTWTQMARNLAHIPKPIVAIIDHMIRRANLNTHSEIVEAVKSIKNIFKAAKTGGIDPKILFAKNEDGSSTGNLIGRISKEFYDTRDTINNSFSEAISHANGIVSKQKRWDRLKSAVNNKNAQLRSSVYIINAEDILSGKKDQVRNKLIELTGDASYADNLIAEALFKYENWTSLKEYIETNGQKSKEDIDKWIKNTSPVEYKKYVNKSDNGNDIRLYNSIENYVVEVPLKTAFGKNTKFYNNVFNDTILSNKAALDFYNQYYETLSKYVGYLPKHLTKNISEYFLPNVKKSMIGRVFKDGASQVFSNMSAEIRNSVLSDTNGPTTSHPNSIFPHKRIKTQYLSELAVNEKSDDLEEILIKFAEMAIAHKHLSNVEDKVLLANAIVKNMKKDIINPDGTKIGTEGRGNLVHLQKILDHTIYSNLYGENTEPDKPINVKVYDKKKVSIKIIGSVNPIPILAEYEKLSKSVGDEEAARTIAESKEYGQHVIVVNEKEAAKELETKLRTIREAHEDGDLDVHKYEQLKSIYESTLSKMGKNIIPSKVGDVFIMLGALKSFSYNPFPVMANLGFGMVQMFTHAAGRTDFTPTEAFNGTRAAIASVIESINAESTDNNKLHALALRLHIIQDLLDNMKIKGMNIFGPFGLLSSSDYILRVSILHAMLSHQKIADLKGNERSLLDAFNSDGSWNVEEFGQQEGWNASYDSELGNQDLYSFANNVKRVNQILHGNMDSEMSYEMKRNIFGRFVTQYRLSWLADGIDARWGDRRHDYIAGRDIEGTYKTAARFVKEQGVSKTMGVIMRLMVGQGEAAFDNIKMSEEDKKLVIGNIRKQLMEIYILAGALGAGLMLKASIDEDDEEQQFNYTAINMLNRIITDTTFYISPTSFQQITNNVIPALGIITDFIRFNNALWQHWNGDEYYTNEIVLKSATRMFPMLNLYNKFEYNSTRVL